MSKSKQKIFQRPGRLKIGDVELYFTGNVRKYIDLFYVHIIVLYEMMKSAIIFILIIKPCVFVTLCLDTGESTVNILRHTLQKYTSKTNRSNSNRKTFVRFFLAESFLQQD